jgi:hypothetical protein
MERVLEDEAFGLSLHGSCKTAVHGDWAPYNRIMR